jgi:hypothetical protein
MAGAGAVVQKEVVEGVGEEGTITEGQGRAPMPPGRCARVAMPLGARSTPVPPWRGWGVAGPEGGGEGRGAARLEG